MPSQLVEPQSGHAFQEVDQIEFSRSTPPELNAITRAEFHRDGTFQVVCLLASKLCTRTIFNPLVAVLNESIVSAQLLIYVTVSYMALAL